MADSKYIQLVGLHHHAGIDHRHTVVDFGVGGKTGNRRVGFPGDERVDRAEQIREKSAEQIAGGSIPQATGPPGKLRVAVKIRCQFANRCARGLEFEANVLPGKHRFTVARFTVSEDDFLTLQIAAGDDTFAICDCAKTGDELTLRGGGI